MAKKFYRFGNGIAKAQTFETVVCDDSAVVNLICGHCRKMTSESIMHCYCDPEKSGVSYEEQDETWRSTVGESQRCVHCRVLNVATSVEEYLRQQREISAEISNLMDGLLGDE